MGTKKNVRARTAVTARRELRLDWSEQRQLEIDEQNEQQRAREFRAAQKRDHHRGWRTRAHTDEPAVAAQDRSGEGPSEPFPGEEPNINLNDVDEPWGQEHDVEVVGGRNQTGESLEENREGLTQATDSTTEYCEDRECPRLTPRNRKCCAAASKGVNHLMQLLDAGFTHEEKMVLHRYFADDRVRALDPELCTAVLKLHSVATTTVQSLRV
ncbi:hypothetical protein M758_UG091800 [Ceratodon purpureus]|nr:hypothetical protein M758_UG091800 [Ceratodon purpureus]